MKNVYELEVDGVKFVVELDKLQLSYIDDLALYEQEIINRRNQKIIFRGVLDKNYLFVVKPAENYSNIEIYPKNNIILEKTIRDNTGIQISNKTIVYHLKKIENEDSCQEIRSDIKYYEKLNDTTLKVTSGSENLEFLYNVIEGKKISRPFNSIGEFKEYNYGKKMAITKDVIKYCDGSNNKYYLLSIIDEDGFFRAPIVSSYDSMIYEIGESGYYKALQTAIFETNKKIMAESTQSIKLLKNLIK